MIDFISYHLLVIDIHAREPLYSNSAVIAWCSRRVHKIVYLAVNKGNILVIFFTSENIHHELSSLINPAVYLLNKMFVR